MSEASLPVITAPVLKKKKFYGTPGHLQQGSSNVIIDCEDATDWNEDIGTATDDAVNYKEGTQSVKGTSTLGGQLQIDVDMSIEAIGTKTMWFWIYVNDSTQITPGTMYIRIGDDGAYALKGTYYFTFQDGWQLIRVLPSDWTFAGGMTVNTAIGALRFHFSAVAGQQPWCSFDQVCYGDTLPAMLIMFDDGLDDVYDTAYPIMKRRNIPGTTYVISDNIGAAGYMTSAELLEIYNWGWCIANHTDDHSDLTGLTQAQIETALSDCETALVGWGIDNDGPKHVAYPGGAHDDDGDLAAAMTAQSMLTGRTVHTTPNPTLPFLLPYHIPMIKQFGNTLSLAQAKTYVDDVIAGPYIGTCLFHQLVAGVPASTSEWNIDDFTEWCAYLGQKRIRCITIDEAWRLQSSSLYVRKAR